MRQLSLFVIPSLLTRIRIRFRADLLSSTSSCVAAKLYTMISVNFANGEVPEYERIDLICTRPVPGICAGSDSAEINLFHIAFPFSPLLP